MKKNSPFKKGTSIFSRENLFWIDDIQKSKHNKDDDKYLQNILYLSLFLENYVLHEEFVILSNAIERFAFDSDLMTEIFELKNIQIIEPSQEIELEWSEQILSEIAQKEGLKEEEYVFTADYQLDENIAYEVKYWNKHMLSYIPALDNESVRTMNYFEKLNSKFTDLLLIEYFKLTSELKNELNELVSYGKDLSVFIPPISALVFERASSVSDIIAVATTLKEEFREVRKAMVDYEMRIQDNELSLKESLVAVKEFQLTMQKLRLRIDNNTSSSLKISEWRDLSNVLKVFDGVNLNDASSLTSMILGKPLTHISNNLKTRKVKYLYQLVDNFLEIKNYALLVEKLFGKPITKKNIAFSKNNGFENLILK